MVSNASMWDTLHLLPAGAQPKPKMQQQADDTPMNRSFMHLHLGFDATGHKQHLNNSNCHVIVNNLNYQAQPRKNK